MEVSEDSLFLSVKEIISQARLRVFRDANSALLLSYCQIGQLNVEDEQQGKERAEYGKYTLKNLSKRLTMEFRKGYDESNLRNLRSFFQAFPIRDALRHELSWTHYRLLLKQEKEQKKLYYLTETIDNNWSSRDLKRQINSLAYERLLQHQKSPIENIHSVLKDPSLFEFLGIKADEKNSEKEIETGIIDHIQKFLLEFGKGFAFVARQQHLKRNEGDNPTIGILICTAKDETIVKYSVLNDKNNLFARKYLLYLPKEEELKQIIDQERIRFELDKEDKLKVTNLHFQ